MPYAITPFGVGVAVGYREVHAGESKLADGETFIVADNPQGKVLAEDGVSLRLPSDAEALDSIKKTVTDDVEMARVTAIAAGSVSYSGAEYPTTDSFMLDLLQAIVMMDAAASLSADDQKRLPTPIPAAIPVTANDGSVQLLTRTDLVLLASTVSVYKLTQFQKANGLWEAISAAKDVATVQAVSW